jgi:uncharacterized membrane protein
MTPLRRPVERDTGDDSDAAIARVTEFPVQRERVVPARARSLAKSLTWRATAGIDTFIIAYVVTGSATWAGSILGIEAITKIFIYYLHERAWAWIPWGRG